MGFLFNRPKVPEAPKAPRPPSVADPAVALAAAASASRARAAAGGGFSNTIRTSPQGDTGTPAFTRTSLLGTAA